MLNLEILAPRIMRAALVAAVLLATLASSGGFAVAQPSYPERSIRIVTINAPGGSADIIARLIGDKLSASLGKPVVVEGMPGAGGSLAAAHVAKAAPDGYTLLMSGDAALVTNISLYDKLAYDPVKDLAPISQVVATPNVLVVPADLPVKTVAELVALGALQARHVHVRARRTRLLHAPLGRTVQDDGADRYPAGHVPDSRSSRT